MRKESDLILEMSKGAQQMYILDTLIALRNEQVKGAAAGSQKALERSERITAAIACVKHLAAPNGFIPRQEVLPPVGKVVSNG